MSAFWGHRRMLLGASLILCSVQTIALADQHEKVPGNSIANSAPSFMQHFQEKLRNYSERQHQCSSPTVIDTSVVRYSKIDTTQNIPLLTGPIYEEWKVLACGKKFFLYVGMAPDEDNQADILFATAFKELEW